jgi:deoxyribodipyrimidine photo-lyase
VIVSEEDLTPESWGIPRNDLAGIVVVDTAEAYPGIGKLPSTFKREALEGTVALLESYAQRPVALLGGGQTEITAGLRLHLRESGAASLSLMDLPVGPARTHIEPVLSELVREGVALRRLRRPWDESFWPHATHGFFKLKERIPSVLKRLGLP